MSGVGPVLIHGLVPLANKAATWIIAATHDIVTLDVSYLAHVDMARLFRVFLSLTLTTSDPVTSWHVAFQNETGSVSEIVSLVELVHELLGLLQDLIVSRRPERLVHAGSQCRRSVRDFSIAESHPVVMDSRVEQYAPLFFVFSKVDEVLGLMRLSIFLSQLDCWSSRVERVLTCTSNVHICTLKMADKILSSIPPPHRSGCIILRQY